MTEADDDPTPRWEELPGGPIFLQTFAEAEASGGRHWRNATAPERDRMATDAAVARRRANAQARRAGYATLAEYIAATEHLDPTTVTRKPKVAAIGSVAPLGDRRPSPIAASEVDPTPALEDHYLIDGVVRPGRLLVLAAAEGVGKSRARMELGMRLATGHGALFDHYRIPARVRVLTIDVENGDEEEIRREEETRERLGLERSDLTDYYRVSLDGLDLTNTKDQEDVRSIVGECRPSLTIFDTGSSMVGDEWGDPLKAAVRFLRSVSSDYGTAVLVAVHLTKPSRQTRPGKDAPKHGTSLSDVMGQWTRQADSVALMADAGADRIRWAMAKRVPPSTPLLDRTDGTFHAVQLLGGDDLGEPMKLRVLSAIAAGEVDAKEVAACLTTTVRTVRRHIATLREEGTLSPDLPYRLVTPVTRPVTGGIAA